MFLDGNELTQSCSLVCVFIFSIANFLLSMFGGNGNNKSSTIRFSLISVPSPDRWHFSAVKRHDLRSRSSSCVSMSATLLRKTQIWTNWSELKRFSPSSCSDRSTAVFLSQDEQRSTENARSEQENLALKKQNQRM